MAVVATIKKMTKYKDFILCGLLEGAIKCVIWLIVLERLIPRTAFRQGYIYSRTRFREIWAVILEVQW